MTTDDQVLHGVPAPPPDTLSDAHRAVLVFMTSPNYRPNREIVGLLGPPATSAALSLLGNLDVTKMDPTMAPLLDGKWVEFKATTGEAGYQLTEGGRTLVAERGWKAWMPASYAHLLDVYDDPRTWTADMVFNLRMALERLVPGARIAAGFPMPRQVVERGVALGWWLSKYDGQSLTEEGQLALQASQLRAESEGQYRDFTVEAMTRGERFVLAAMALPDFDPHPGFHGEVMRLLDAGLVDLVPFKGYALSAKGWDLMMPRIVVVGPPPSKDDANKVELFFRGRGVPGLQVNVTSTPLS